jgi:peptidoglycan-associated lipoprotein
MPRTHRVLALALVAAAALAACRKKPETAVQTVSNPAPPETCDQRCRDSISAAEAARRAADSAEAARRAAEGRRAAMEATRNALLAKILFDYDMSDIRSDAKAVLDAKLPILRGNPGVRLRVSGHADERGSDEYNLALSQRRAAATKRYFTDNGIDPSRIEIVGYGEERPATNGMDETSFAQNRRAEFEIIAGGDNLVPVRASAP